MLDTWNLLSEDLQLMVSRAALSRAVDAIACQAEILAEEIEAGIISDRGGAEALRLLATVARSTADEVLPFAGHA